MTDIYKRIQTVLVDFKMFSGRDPTAIYLGQKEHLELMAWHEAQRYEQRQPNKRLINFMGIQVYKVSNLNNHLGVGLCQE